MNILILSVGTRNKIVQYFKKAVGADGKIIATDMSRLAPAIYDADQYYIVPKITDPQYIKFILEICKKEHISGVLSLIDPELSLLAKHEKEFVAIGTRVIGSSYALCERALDKMQMYEWLKGHGYPCASSYTDLEKFYEDLDNSKIAFPVFVKPVRGSASIAINKVYDKDMLNLLFKHNQGLMIQEFLDGEEIGADCYIDFISGELVSVFTKKKLVMRAGETDKAVSFRNEKLIEEIEKFVRESGWRGQIDIDLFDVNGTYYFSEVNPRFGGGYPHAYECGVDHMKLIINNLKGQENRRELPEYDEDIYMMKYSEVALWKG